MGIFDALRDSAGGLLADQWKDIVTVEEFGERTLVSSGVFKRSRDDRGSNRGSKDVLSNGSVIYVPENTAAFIFSQSGIEQVVTTPGGYIYRNGQATILGGNNGQNGLGRALFGQAAERFGFSGMTPDEKRVAFLNLRELRNLKFGTRGPLVYHDVHYGADLELFAYGSFAVRVTNPERCIRGFVPANATEYTLDSKTAREQLVVELLGSFTAAVNALSETLRLAQLPAQAHAIREAVATGPGEVAAWSERFGLELSSFAIENIEYSEASRQLVNRYAERRMEVLAYEGISQGAASIAAQQLVAQGVRDNGLGDAGGMLFGMNLASGLNPMTAAFMQPAVAGATGGPAPTAAGSGPGAAPGSADNRAGAQPTLDERIATLEKLKALADAGVLTPEEFAAKKNQLLEL